MANGKTLFCRGSGGWSTPREVEASKQNLPAVQLYDMKNDPKESVNLHLERPEIVEQMTETLRRFIENGRSTPGSPATKRPEFRSLDTCPLEKIIRLGI